MTWLKGKGHDSVAEQLLGLQKVPQSGLWQHFQVGTEEALECVCLAVLSWTVQDLTLHQAASRLSPLAVAAFCSLAVH